MSDRVFRMHGWTYRTFAQSPDVGHSAEGLQVWDSPPQCAVSWHLQFARPAFPWSSGQPGNPSRLLTPSSPSFDGRGETPAAPFQQLLAVKLPVANPGLAQDLAPCEMWNHGGCDV